MNAADARDERKVNMISTLVVWCTVCCICMVVMLVVASQKTIVITDAGQEQTTAAGEQEVNVIPGGELLLRDNKELEKQLAIPLGEGIKAENVVVENHYMDREVWIYIQNTSHIFYAVNALEGDVSYIEDGRYEAKEDGVVLKLKMFELLEYRSTLANQKLQVAFYQPEEVYEQVVVIDPVGNNTIGVDVSAGNSVQDITLRVTGLLQKKIAAGKIKLYFTRTEAAEVSDEQCLSLIEETGADLFLRIGTSYSEKENIYGIQTYYNDEYYIPGFGNAEWADIVTKEVTIGTSNRAIGLVAAEDDSILRRLEIPGAQVNIGFLSNEQESTLLQQESYLEKIAGSIAEAILSVYTEK